MQCFTDAELAALVEQARKPLEEKLEIALAELRTVANTTPPRSRRQQAAMFAIFKITGITHKVKS